MAITGVGLSCTVASLFTVAMSVSLVSLFTVVSMVTLFTGVGLSGESIHCRSLWMSLFTGDGLSGESIHTGESIQRCRSH